MSVRIPFLTITILACATCATSTAPLRSSLFLTPTPDPTGVM